MKYKALVKYEMKTIPWMLVYFTIVFGIILRENTLSPLYINFLEGKTKHIVNPVMENLISYDRYKIWSLAVLGIVVLVYMQFRDIKNTDVGRFLKVMPFKSTDIYWVKFISGVLSYTIPYALFAIGILVNKQANAYWIEDLLSTSIGGNFLLKADSYIQVGLCLVLIYFILTLTYSFFVMMQYIITNRVLSLAIAGISMFVPIFIMQAIQSIYEVYSEFIHVLTYNTMPWFFIQGRSQWIDSVTGCDCEAWYVPYMTAKVLICIVLSVIIISVTHLLAKHFKIENGEVAIAFKGARYSFTIGASLCCALLIGVIAKEMLYDVDSAQLTFVILHISMIVAAAIGALISYKVAHIGQVHK